MSITHIVLLKFKEGIDPNARDEIIKKCLALKDDCVDATSQKPYILHFEGGTNNSNQGLEDGATHAFVAKFASKADVEYYLKEDPVHRKFSADVRPFASKFVIVDFTPGVFEA